MIKFFRKIRHRLLTENRFSKYLLYAVGEIVLVVIGILIALQINNWNEERKTVQLELSLLHEMKEDLLSDILDMQENVGYNKQAMRSANIILSAFNQLIPENDSLKKHYSRVAVVAKYMTSTNAYNSMNDNGMRIVSNDSLRRAITEHYQRNNDYILDWNKSEWNLMFTDQQSIYRKFFEKYRYIGEASPVNYEELRKSQEYYNYLNNRLGMLMASTWYYEHFGIASAERLIALIELELDKRSQ